MEMKEMTYSLEPYGSEVLYREDDGEYRFVVMNTRGSHICAYIQFPGVENLQSYEGCFEGGDEGEWACAHGGFTYLDDFIGLGSGKWLGWDYAHFGDFTAIDSLTMHAGLNKHKWTTKEVADEARALIQFIKTGAEFKYYDEDEEEES